MFLISEIKWLQSEPTLHIVLGNIGGWQRKVVCRFVELLHLEDQLCCESLNILEVPTPTRDHPVLWGWTEPHCELYFSAAPADPNALIGQLAAAHEAVAGRWFPFHTWLAQQNVGSQVEMLRSGSGCFAHGPQPVMRAYHDILSMHGCRPSLLRTGGGAEMTDEEVRSSSQMSALIFCPQFYVLAASFEIQEL